MQDVLNRALADRETLQAEFSTASPFKHVFIENFLQEKFLEQISSSFPHPKSSEMVSEFGDKSLKHTVENIRGIGGAFKRWDDLLRSDKFILWLESVTGIPDLVFDPYYTGAGTHNNFHGQSLDMHIDFNRHPITGLHRRLNLIVYLCPEWKVSWGGSIQLEKDAWDRNREKEYVRYLPLANHAILFETSEESWHGFSRINLPREKLHLSRKSLTVYYYTREREDAEVTNEHSTIYVPDWIPQSVKPGKVLSDDAYRELESVMYRRDHYLQHIYRRESEAYQHANNALDRIAQLDRFHQLVRRLIPWRYK